jgi:hypothetical protein
VSDEQKTVATPSAAHQAMLAHAAPIRTLMHGTKAMRAAGEIYLPRAAMESVEAYRDRIGRSVLFNAIAKTVEDMNGKVFDKPIILKDNVPAQIVAAAENIDLAGRHINVFASHVFADAIQPGIGYIFVDMPPPVTRSDGAAPTLADEQQAGHRPYLVYIPQENLIGWKSETIGGTEVLTQVRIRECVAEPDGPWDVKSVEQIRVLLRGGWEIWREGKDGNWFMFDSGRTSIPEIPIVPVYINRTGFMTGAPPLEKLAEKNIEHWQSSSDQKNILHVARLPILFAAGFNENEEVIIGASQGIRASNPDASLEYVEHSGQAITAGRDDIKDIEFQMQALGLMLLVPKPGQTATGEVRDDSKENSPLAMMARALGDAIERAFGFMAEYMGLGKDAGGEVDVNKDYGIKAGALADIPNIIAAKAAGIIDTITALEEFKRRGFLSDSVDPETVKARADAEVPELDAGPGNGMDME